MWWAEGGWTCWSATWNSLKESHWPRSKNGQYGIFIKYCIIRYGNLVNALLDADYLNRLVSTDNQSCNCIFVWISMIYSVHVYGPFLLVVRLFIQSVSKAWVTQSISASNTFLIAMQLHCCTFLLQTPETSTVYHRFYLSLMLHYLLKTNSPSAIWKVANLFQCSRGFLQSVVNSTASFASCLTYFTQVGEIKWSTLEL